MCASHRPKDLRRSHYLLCYRSSLTKQYTQQMYPTIYFFVAFDLPLEIYIPEFARILTYWFEPRVLRPARGRREGPRDPWGNPTLAISAKLTTGGWLPMLVVDPHTRPCRLCGLQKNISLPAVRVRRVERLRFSTENFTVLQPNMTRSNGRNRGNETMIGPVPGFEPPKLALPIRTKWIICEIPLRLIF